MTGLSRALSALLLDVAAGCGGQPHRRGRRSRSGGDGGLTVEIRDAGGQIPAAAPGPAGHADARSRAVREAGPTSGSRRGHAVYGVHSC